jgi:hypothetical protein
MVEISLSGSGEGPGATQRPGLLDTRRLRILTDALSVLQKLAAAISVRIKDLLPGE